MKPLRRVALLGATLAATTAALVAGGSAVAQTPRECPATFHVLHDDRIGVLELPAGEYRLHTAGHSCAKAAQLFAEFLQDYDGVLPGAWDYTVQGVGRGTFLRGDSGVEIEVRRIGGVPNTNGHSNGGGGSHGQLACPDLFTVEHNDRIGQLRLRRGEYRITRLGRRISCAKTVKLLQRFLERPSGDLGKRWVVLPDAAEFVRGSTHYGFSVDRVGG
jgi:hypothetical protein